MENSYSSYFSCFYNWIIFNLALQPFIAFTSAKFKEIEARSIRGQISLITLSENGLWLKEENSENNTYYIIHSLGMIKDMEILKM